MFWILINCFGISVCIWVYYKWTRVKRYWAEKGVPHLTPHPILGSLSFLQRENPGVWMRKIYENHKHPYLGAWWFWRPALIVNSPDIARNVLVKDFPVFRDRFLSSGKTDPIGGLNLFTTNDPLWSWIRRRLAPIFTASKLRALQNLFDTKSKELIQRINNEKDKTKINLKIVFTDFTTDIIGIASFGIASDSTLTGEGPMRTVTHGFMNFDLYRGLCWSSIFFWPELVDIFRFSFFPKSTTDYFLRIFRTIAQERANKGDDEPKDLMDALLELRNKTIDDDQDIEVSEDVIVAQAAVFVLGGFDTSGNTLTMAIYELAHHPQIQDKLYKEIKQEVDDGTGILNVTKLAEATYLNCVIKETLRKFSPMGWLDRVAMNDYRVDENLIISAGTPVYINAIGMQYDPELFPEPERFIPERFLPENKMDIKSFTYLPFGDGPRNCIGQRFGLMTLRHAISRIILNYKLEPVPGSPLPNEIEIEKRGLFLFPGEPLHVKFLPRE
ncbi:cytochrome P450 6k1-like isoform X2 [Leptidea sinapis]|uniref:cytochrome P450 6k1-like isoform X2 n=1 Tax=Leptidea sinapis TaxID=189913 RepID=UPI0021C2E549|nr:cytochrome P450 6k1-like isoform X2 [Leptidea sinapis]